MSVRTIVRKTINICIRPLGLQVGRYRPKSDGYRQSLNDALAGVREPLVLDVGANEGQAAREILESFPNAEVHSFEPFPKAFGALKENLSGANAFAHNVALGEAEGEAEFVVYPHSQQNSILGPAEGSKLTAPYLHGEHRTIRVPVKRLDDEAERLVGARLVDYLKIDVQGFENRVLRGAERTLERTRFLMIEVSFNPVYSGGCLVDEICHLLRERRFRLVRSIGYLPGERVDDLVSSDFFFRNTRLAGAQEDKG